MLSGVYPAFDRERIAQLFLRESRVDPAVAVEGRAGISSPTHKLDGASRRDRGHRFRRARQIPLELEFEYQPRPIRFMGRTAPRAKRYRECDGQK